MGGRTERKERQTPDRELWIQEVSEQRLARYELMLSSGGRVHRSDGSTQRTNDQQAYFRDLIARERNRRNRT
ncbi:hypothetical protein [Methyloversatilis thermotolerans]|uniref:hypothetical protein n=1 Tax=Methyloversatilis thermotolerans TaxID=1346290 RepID=UPI00036915C7|nr:hypothetical protein [Methyloversatilis thermotolerans]